MFLYHLFLLFLIIKGVFNEIPVQVKKWVINLLLYEMIRFSALYIGYKMRKNLLKFGLSLLMISPSFLIGNETTTDLFNWKDYEDTFYFAHEFHSLGGHSPSIGYRVQKNKWSLDGSIGYKYIPLYSKGMHLANASIKALYSLVKQENSQTYVGIGISSDFMKNGGDSYFENKDYSFTPTLTVGRDFSINETKKIFCEIIYKPYVWGKDCRGKVHFTSFRIGIGF